MIKINLLRDYRLAPEQCIDWRAAGIRQVPHQTGECLKPSVLCSCTIK